MSQIRECPGCGDPPGPATVCIQTREYKDTTLFTGRDRYLVRTRELPGICEACDSGLRKGRTLAGMVCLVPLVVLFVGGVLADAKPLMWGVLGYLLYLAKRLDYTWADHLLYGSAMQQRLAPHVPAGDPGSTTLPAGWGHMILRVAVIPVGLVLFVVGGTRIEALVSRGGGRGSSGASASPRVAPSYPADRLEHARMLLSSARDLAVPVDLTTTGLLDQTALGMDGIPLEGSKELTVRLPLRVRKMGGKRVQELDVHENPGVVPAGTTYQLMSGRQLLAAFLADRNAEFLLIQGAEPGMGLALYRFEAERLLSGLPPAEPVPGRVFRK